MAILGGDLLLKSAAETVRKSLRTSDYAFRIGGDEFAVLLPHADTEQATALADRMHTVFASGVHSLQLEIALPFVNIGIANGILDTRLLSQPYRSLQDFATQGFLFYAEGGASVRVGSHLNAGASYYQFVPSGQEKIFAQNLLVQPSGSLTVSDITHDHGATAFVRFAPTRFVYIEPSYVHNIQLDDNAVTFRVGIDLRSATSRSRGPSN